MLIIIQLKGSNHSQLLWFFFLERPQVFWSKVLLKKDLSNSHTMIWRGRNMRVMWHNGVKWFLKLYSYLHGGISLDKSFDQNSSFLEQQMAPWCRDFGVKILTSTGSSLFSSLVERFNLGRKTIQVLTTSCWIFTLLQMSFFEN